MKKTKEVKEPTQSLAPRDAETTLERASGAISIGFQTLVQALSGPVRPTTVVSIYSTLNNWEKSLAQVKEIAKDLLKDMVVKAGTETTEKGSKELQIGKLKASVRPWRTGYDGKKVEALLLAKELDLDKYMDKDIIYKLNVNRLNTAIIEKKLTKDELETCKYEVKYVLQPLEQVSNE
jgi:hypothetical protein